MMARPRGGLALWSLIAWLLVATACTSDVAPTEPHARGTGSSGPAPVEPAGSRPATESPSSVAGARDEAERRDGSTSVSPSPAPAPPELRMGSWRCELSSPGGALPFELIVAPKSDGGVAATVVNGDERIVVPRFQIARGACVLGFDHYDSEIRASVTSDGATMRGTWTKRRGRGSVSRMPFRARFQGGRRFPMSRKSGDTTDFSGRWRVAFSSDDDPAVAVLQARDGSAIQGTILTTTGDYRYLAGAQAAGELRLSCFDGAHAFLFAAHDAGGGIMTGDFWSSDTYHDVFTALRDDAAALPDPLEQVHWTNGATLGELEFPDLSGASRRLDDPAFAGRARIIQVFGSWCPNCHDACDLLVELQRRYGPRGLSILGLAFELTGDFDRDARQVRRYLERHGASYPVLIAGTADKSEATRRLKVLDFVKSYPTTIFLRSDGSVRAIYSGFSGPATGAEYDRLRARFESIIEELLQG